MSNDASSWSTLTGTQESCTTPSCGPQPPGHVRSCWRFMIATSTVFLVQLTLACTRSRTLLADWATWLCGTGEPTPMLWRTLGEHPWLCSLRTKPRRAARCQRKCSTDRRLISVQARSFSRSGVCRANLFGPARSPKTQWPFRWLKGPGRSFAREYDKLQTLFLSRVVQPSTVLIGHGWLPSEPVG